MHVKIFYFLILLNPTQQYLSTVHIFALVAVSKSIPLRSVLHLSQLHLTAVFQIHQTDRGLRQSKTALDALRRQQQEMTNRMASLSLWF